MQHMRARVPGSSAWKIMLIIAALVGQAAVSAQGATAGFDAASPPTPPDYAEPSSWAATPDRPGAAAAVAPGASARAARPRVDVFYVHPTTDGSLDRWNQPLDDAKVNRWTDESVVARQAGIFNGCCRVFAPRYRQATRRAFQAFQGDGAKAFALAYGDVERAFDRYLRTQNKGRSFILVGHSQGASHVAKLLERRIDGTPLARRMVAAYVIGFTLYEGEFARRYHHLQPCRTPSQTGCVIGWNSVLAGSDLTAAAAVGRGLYAKLYGTDEGNTMLCFNPLTFDTGRPMAGAEASQGAAPGDPGYGPLKPLRPHSVAAECAQGLLVVTPNPALGLKPLPGGSMHYHDLGLFYEDIRVNAAARARSFLAARSKD